MKTTLCWITALLLASLVHAQSLKKYPISNSGCFAYMYCDPGKFDLDYSEDSSKVFTSQCDKEGVTYGVICIKLLNPIPDPANAEEVMISYVDYLKADFHIKSAVGYGKGHRLNNNENTRGILDYWEDNDGNHWKMKAWTDGKFIGVLFGYSKKELPETKVDVFLNSFRLPGM
jgi:hypothetical protein